MILIADSGTTKTDWRLVAEGAPQRKFSTEGINPVFQTREKIAEVISPLRESGLGEIDDIYFYSAGIAASNKATANLLEVFSANFKNCRFHVETDKLGAARALCGRSAGIACIMGTGSNSCFYDGEKITINNVGGGFILGDEGGGANLGKLLVSDYIKDLMPEDIKAEFSATFKLQYYDIISRVYELPMPNRWLASFSPFIRERIDNPYIGALVRKSFNLFIERNVLRFDVKNYPVNVLGSVAYYFEPILREVCGAHSAKLGKILKSPIDELVRFHLSNA